VTDRIVIDLRGAVWNRADEPRKYDVTIVLAGESGDAMLHREQLEVPPKAVGGVALRWPTEGRAGPYRVRMTAKSGPKTLRVERPLEIIDSPVRSTRTIDGAWVDIYHHDPRTGALFNDELARMTADQWRELVRGMHAVGMNTIVNTMLFQNFTHYGEHAIETEGYKGRAYYPSRLYPGRMPTACDDALECILDEADRLHMHVFPGIGMYAFFDFTPASLAWHKRVADEVWQRYGHHPSFYGWYVSEEIHGHLGGTPERRRQIVEFFRAFRAHCRSLAPDKPVMLATNSFGVRSAVDTYRKLLPHLDILCPFGFHRMPADDFSGEEAARHLQSLCDEAEMHLWLDLETFVFHEGGGLAPRPIDGLTSDLRRFPNFEKILCYEFPGLMSAPAMSRKPGGEATVKLYEDYRRYVERRRKQRCE